VLKRKMGLRGDSTVKKGRSQELAVGNGDDTFQADFSAFQLPSFLSFAEDFCHCLV